jgi:hypothetical protein
MKKRIPVDIQEQILRLAAGGLNVQEQEIVWEQIIINPDYADFFKTAQAMHLLSKKIKSGTVAVENHPNESYKMYLKVAAVLLLAALLALFIFITPKEEEKITPLATIELNILRSAESTNVSHDLLQTAITLLANNEREEARKILTKLRQNPETTKVWAETVLISGIDFYNAAEYPDAFAEFVLLTQAENKVGFLLFEQALWYKANTLLHLGKQAEALAVIERVANMGGAYSRAAGNLLR